MRSQAEMRDQWIQAAVEFALGAPVVSAVLVGQIVNELVLVARIDEVDVA